MKLFKPIAALALLFLMQSAHSQALSPPSVPIVPEGLRFELRLPDGKTQFQMGETIPVRLLFSNVGKQSLWLNQSGFLPFASFAVEPKEGATNPLGDLPARTFFSIMGALPVPIRLAEKPTEESFSLNEYVRFDRPGSYAIRATTSRVFIKTEEKALAQGFFFGGGSAVTSPSLTLQIVPADPKWQAEQVEAWRSLWARQTLDTSGYGWKTPKGVTTPANDLRFLNTRAGAWAMIDRMGQDGAPRSSGSEAYYWRSGLVGFSDRSWLIGAMKDAMKRSPYAITQGFLDNLATLEELQGGEKRTKQETLYLSPFSAQVEEANWNLALAALPAKKGAVRALTLHTLLETAWLSNWGKSPQVKARLPQLVAQVPDIFGELPPLPQEYLLNTGKYSDEWDRIKGPRMVAPLRRLWAALPVQPGVSYRETPDLIAHRLYELDPQGTRILLLKEMALPYPRASFQALSLVNDKRLPQLQNVWLANLNANGADQDTAALLIGRYATKALQPQIQKEYAERKHDSMFSPEIETGLHRFLARPE